MMKILKKHKWLVHWSIFGLLSISYFLVYCFFDEKSWVDRVLQPIGTLAGFYLTLIIFLYSKQESDLQSRKHLDELQSLNAKQIEALQVSTEKQIVNIQQTTEKQIEAINKATLEQIKAFEKEIGTVADTLSDNATLLAELLCRELEKTVQEIDTIIQEEKSVLNELQEFNIWRLGKASEKQINNQKNRIQRWIEAREYYKQKLDSIQNYLNE